MAPSVAAEAAPGSGWGLSSALANMLSATVVLGAVVGAAVAASVLPRGVETLARIVGQNNTL